MTVINLNADLGEGFGPWRMGDDAALLGLVGAANIACGGHAGDATTMRAVCAEAAARGVDIGAHPGFDDLRGFGRRAYAVSPDDAAALTAAQTGALMGAAALAGAKLAHVKPHGALNAIAAADRAIADAVAAAVKAIDASLILLAPALSALSAAGAAAGLRVAQEAFADRTYQPDGRLTLRRIDGAVLHDPDAVGLQAARIVAQGGLPLADGGVLPTKIDSICVHGDSPAAVVAARRVHNALSAAGCALQPLSRMFSER